MASEVSGLMNMLEEMKMQSEQQAAEMRTSLEQTRAEMKTCSTETRTSLEQTVANMQGTAVDLEEKLKHHQDEAAAGFKRDVKSGQELVMNGLEEQRQAVSQGLENQDQRISATEKHIEEQLETTRKHVKEQLQQVKDHVSEMFRELSIELLHGQVQNRMQQAKENLTTFGYEVQAFINSPIEIQEYVAARQFVEGIANLDVQRIVSLSSPKNVQDALVKALETEAATKATRMTRRVRSVEEDDEVEVRATSLTSRRRGTYHRNLPVRTAPAGTEKFTCWRCGQKDHLRVGCRMQVTEKSRAAGTNTESEN
nr:unnamed protein product [Callosobruchus chinensis]